MYTCRYLICVPILLGKGRFPLIFIHHNTCVTVLHYNLQIQNGILEKRQRFISTWHDIHQTHLTTCILIWLTKQITILILHFFLVDNLRPQKILWSRFTHTLQKSHTFLLYSLLFLASICLLFLFFNLPTITASVFDYNFFIFHISRIHKYPILINNCL